MERGEVKRNIYKLYFTAMGMPQFIFLMGLFVVGQALQVPPPSLLNIK